MVTIFKKNNISKEFNNYKLTVYKRPTDKEANILNERVLLLLKTWTQWDMRILILSKLALFFYIKHIGFRHNVLSIIYSTIVMTGNISACHNVSLGYFLLEVWEEAVFLYLIEFMYLVAKLLFHSKCMSLCPSVFDKQYTKVL